MAHGLLCSRCSASVVANVPSKTRKQRTVAQALHDQSWPADTQGELSLIGLIEYFQLWDMLLHIHLSQEEDMHIWKLDARVFLLQICLSCFIQWSNSFWALASAMETGGSFKMQSFSLARHLEPVMDSRQTCKARPSASAQVSTIWGNTPQNLG